MLTPCAVCLPLLMSGGFGLMSETLSLALRGVILIDRLRDTVVTRARHVDEDGGGSGMSDQDEG